MTVITRFAPSPTGDLHVGGVRTALFNYLFARHHGGKFRLRIEDTDRERSTQHAIDVILGGMKWLGLSWDGDVVFQSQQQKRHQQVAQQLYEKGQAYYCQCSAEHLQQMRDERIRNGQSPIYPGTCREKKLTAGALRLKVSQMGQTEIKDLVQGPITIRNDQIDDMVLLRTDGTPTYMLSVVVDDHDMGITHVIRGADHLTNAFRQHHLYQAMGWVTPLFAHIPLIHGPDGRKLSKRHGAVSIDAYQEMGYLPVALRNYLLRLGWSHGDDEIISDAQAISWFDLEHVGQSAARFDFKKLDALNAHYLRATPAPQLRELIEPDVESLLGRKLSDADKKCLEQGMSGLVQRANNVKDLAKNALFYVHALPLNFSEEGKKVLEACTKDFLHKFQQKLGSLDKWGQVELEQMARDFAASEQLKLGQVAQIVRVVLTGHTISPSIFEIMAILGPGETRARFEQVIADFGKLGAC